VNDVAIPADLLTIPAELRVPADAASAARGEQMAQWFLRRQAIGIRDRARCAARRNNFPKAGWGGLW